MVEIIAFLFIVLSVSIAINLALICVLYINWANKQQ